MRREDSPLPASVIVLLEQRSVFSVNHEKALCPLAPAQFSFLPSSLLLHYGVQWLRKISLGCRQVSVPHPLSQGSSLASSLEVELSGE